MKRKQVRKTSFLIGMLRFAVFFLCAATIGLVVLFRILDDYEKANEQVKPERAVESYMASLNAEHILESQNSFLQSLDTNIQSVDVSSGIIRDFLSSGITAIKDPQQSNNSRVTYVLESSDTVIGSFEICESDEIAYGLKPWHVSSESFDFSFLLGAPCSFTVPEDYSVYCNGVLLDESYHIKDNIRFDYLKDYYDSGYALPYLCTYEIGNYLSDVDIQIFDERGEPAEINDSSLQEEYLSRCCDGEIKESVLAFLNVFLEKYVAFTGSSKWDYLANYYELENYMVKGSDIQVRTYNTMDSLVFGTYRSNILKEIDTRFVFDIGNSLIYCDTTYYVDCYGTMGYVTTVNNIRILLQKTDSGYLAYEILEKSTDTIKQ